MGKLLDFLKGAGGERALSGRIGRWRRAVSELAGTFPTQVLDDSCLWNQTWAELPYVDASSGAMVVHRPS